MIDFHTYNEIHEHRNRQHLSFSEIANLLSIDTRTVRKWSNRKRYITRKRKKKKSILDPFKPAIRSEIELMQTSAAKIYEDLQKQGYHGGKTIVEEYVSYLKPIVFVQNCILPNRWMHMFIQGKITAVNLINETNEQLTLQEAKIIINRIIKGTLSERNRVVAVTANLKGIPVSQISKFLMIDNRTVENYLGKYCQNGIDGLLAYREGTTKKHEQNNFKCSLFSILHSPPKDFGINRTSWRMTDLHRIMSEQGYPINIDSIRLIIRNAGFRYRKAKKVLTSTDPQYRQKLGKITKILSKLSESEKFFSIDEYGPFAIKMQGGKSLVPKGTTKIIPQWQKNKGSLIMTAALELSTNQITHFYSQNKNTDEMIKLLNVLIEQYKDQEIIYLSWDAASWHASKKLDVRVDEINSNEFKVAIQSPIVKLAPLPTCAQFLNVIESVFSGMARAIIHNSNYESVKECQDAIDKYFDERNEYFRQHPKQAGNKIWGKERVTPTFDESKNCKDPMYR